MELYTFELGRKLCMFICLLMIEFYDVNAQLSVSGTPESFLIKTKAAQIIPQKQLNILNSDSLLTLDNKYNISNRYGILQPLSVDIKTEGVKTAIEGKGTIWRYEITSGMAYSLGIHFNSYHLPEGAKLFIYNERHDLILGAFTSLNNTTENQLSIAEFKGRNAIIEYFEPTNVEFSGTLKMGAISQAYKDIYAILNGRIGINCPEGRNWQDEKHAVCNMTFRESTGSYYCTGFLVNNVRQDGTPYFQTACHCIDNNNDASTLITYFNDEVLTCPNTDSIRNFKTLSGAKFKAANTRSDFSLLLLNNFPPDSYLAYYAGWDVSDRDAKSGVCIHHPGSAPKCIAIDSGPPVTYPFSILWLDDNNLSFTSAPNTHWRVLFDEGNIESGSSGAPLFDDNKRVIGQLHGGNNNASFFGKTSISWNYSNAIDKQLQIWLDPDLTGKQFVDGAYIRFKPKADFNTALTHVCTGAIVKLNDKSKYNPSEWDWTISPSGYKYVNGTTPNSINPEVVFDSIGTYSVSLITKNSYDADTLSKKDYIIVNNTIHVSMSNIPADSILCGKSVIQYPLRASGALEYNFSLEKEDKINYTVQSDSLFLSLKPHSDLEGSFDSWVKVVGTFGSCKSSDSAHLKIVFQTNDDIKNAIMLLPGINTSFSNECATVEENEPHPPLGGCYTDTGKCYGSGQIPKNTIWFTFVGPPSGKVSIATHGFDNRIAAYDAEFYDNKNTYYRLLAANETGSSNDGTAHIENLPVVPGKVYWLQMDGSNGKTGICSIELYTNNVEIIPNPTNGKIDVILSTDNKGIAEMEIFSLLGKLLLRRRLDLSQDSKRFSFDLSAFPQGMYLVKTNLYGSVTKSKLLIVK